MFAPSIVDAPLWLAFSLQPARRRARPRTNARTALDRSHPGVSCAAAAWGWRDRALKIKLLVLRLRAADSRLAGQPPARSARPYAHCAPARARRQRRAPRDGRAGRQQPPCDASPIASKHSLFLSPHAPSSLAATTNQTKSPVRLLLASDANDEERCVCAAPHFAACRRRAADTAHCAPMLATDGSSHRQHPPSPTLDARSRSSAARRSAGCRQAHAAGHAEPVVHSSRAPPNCGMTVD